MIRSSPLLRRFEQASVKRAAPDFRENLRIIEALYEEALTLGAFPLEDPLQHIEVDIRTARAFNVQTPSENDWENV